MTSSTLFILADAPFALFFIFVIYLLAGPVALVPLAMLPVGFLIGFSMKGRVEQYAAETMEESNRKNGLLIEAIDGIESVKAVSAEWKIKDRWRDLTTRINNTELKSKLLTAISTSSVQSVQQLSYVGIMRQELILSLREYYHGRVNSLLNYFWKSVNASGPAAKFGCSMEARKNCP